MKIYEKFFVLQNKRGEYLQVNLSYEYFPTFSKDLQLAEKFCDKSSVNDFLNKEYVKKYLEIFKDLTLKVVIVKTTIFDVQKEFNEWRNKNNG